MDADELADALADISGFEPDDELTPLLLEDLREMDEDERQKVQIYKARIMKARRDADIDEGVPPWWTNDSAAETMAGLAGEEPSEPSADTDSGEETEEPDEAEPPADEDTDEAGATIDVDPDEIKEAVHAFWNGDTEEDELTDELGEALATAAIAAREAQDEIEDNQVEKRLVESRDELEPTQEELLAADLIDQPVEKEGSNNCFMVPVKKQKASLFYTEDDERLILHNFSLPTTLDNQWGLWIEDQLVKTAFEYAEENDLDVFAERARIYKDFLRRYPEFEDLTKNAA